MYANVCMLPHMAARERFNFFVESAQLAALREIERRTDAPVAAQIRRAIEAYLKAQKAIPKGELRKILAAE
jgi:hypothetical protein